MIVYLLVDGLWKAIGQASITPPGPPVTDTGYGEGGYGSGPYGG